MSSVQETRFLQMIKFSYDLSLMVTRTFMKTNILQNHNNSLVNFLNTNKHELYHLWNNNTKCCACSTNVLLQQNRELNKDQFIKLYDIQGTITSGHFKKGTGKSVLQQCMCGITCKASCSLNDLDIILIHTILRKCVKLSPDDDFWLQTIREIRNKLAHTVSTSSFDTGRLEKWWTKLEGSVLGLAGKVPPFDCYAEAIEKQIKLLRKTDLDKSDVHEFICKIAAENDQILSKQKEEIKEEIIHHLKEIKIDIKNLTFQVNTQKIKQEVCDTTEKDPDTCYIEWRIKTPTDWQVERIKEKLNLFKSLLQDSFKLEFIYVGSLVLETSIRRQHLADDTLLISGVRSFLEKFVELCDIDTDTELTVFIDLSVLQHLRKELVRIPCESCILQDKDVSAISCHWCPECNVTLCVDCLSNHRKDHRTVDVDVKLDFQAEIESHEKCPEHVQHIVDYYCPFHDSICCSACKEDKHKSCEEIIHLEVACKHVDTLVLKDQSEEFHNINESLENLDRELSTNILDIKTDCQIIGSQIADIKSNVIEQINKTEKLLLLKMQEEERKLITQQQEVKKRCKTISAKLIVRANIIKFIKQHGTEKQAFILAHNLQQKLEKHDDSVATIISNTTRKEMVFDKLQDLTSSVPTQLGRIHTTENPSQVQHTPVKQKRAQCSVPTFNKPLTSFKLTSVFRMSGFVNISGMIVTEDNKLLLCNLDKDNIDEVLVTDDNGKYVSTIIMNDKPDDIAVIPGGDQYVVTLPYIRSIQFINSKDLTRGRCVKLPTSSRTCGITADKHYIYVGGYREIFVLNHEGGILRNINLKDCGYVYHLAVNNNNLYASVSGSRIFCIDHSNKIRKTEVIGSGEVLKIIVDQQGYIYVAGERSGKVHRFDKELNETMTVVDYSVEEIAAISFNKDCTKLFVASERGNKIAVFSCF